MLRTIINSANNHNSPRLTVTDNLTRQAEPLSAGGGTSENNVDKL
jgi:hypothetical protein